ncbi:hypothetical protein ACJX0J_041481, partial [Zea mays]
YRFIKYNRKQNKYILDFCATASANYKFSLAEKDSISCIFSLYRRILYMYFDLRKLTKIRKEKNYSFGQDTTLSIIHAKGEKQAFNLCIWFEGKKIQPLYFLRGIS